MLHISTALTTLDGTSRIPISAENPLHVGKVGQDHYTQAKTGLQVDIRDGDDSSRQLRHKPAKVHGGEALELRGDGCTEPRKRKLGARLVHLACRVCYIREPEAVHVWDSARVQ